MNKRILKSLISVTGIVLLAKMLGFIKQMVTANSFGATIETDIISLSEGFISNIDFLLIQALSTAFVPIYLKIKAKDEKRSKAFVSNTIKTFFIITAIISIVFILFSPFISKIIAPSYSKELSSTLSLYFRILSPVLVLIVEMVVFSSLLKANERFIPGELIGIIQSIVLILLVIIFGKRVGPDIQIIGLYIYAVIDLIFLMICSRRVYRISKGNPFSDEYVKKLLIMMVPLILGYSIVFVNQQVDKIIVSGLGEGIITAMGYASVLSNFIITYIGSICSVMFTYVTQKIVANNDKEAAQLTSSFMTQMIVVLLPISILTVMNATDIVTIVFGRGKFGGEAIRNCSLALKGYGFAFVPIIIKEMLSRLQYSYGDSKKPMINSSLSIIINIALSIILSRFIGVFGVTISTSISVAFCAFFNYLTSKKMNSFVRIVTDKKALFNMIIGSLFCIVFSLLCSRFLGHWSCMLRFLIVSLGSLFFYFIINRNSIKMLVSGLKKKKS